MIRRGAPKLDDGIGYDEWRACHNPACGAKFRPAAGLSGESTEYHCSAPCAAACLARRDALRSRLVAAPEDQE